MMAGAIAHARRSTVVERFACSAILAATIVITTANQAAMGQNDLNERFNMVSTLIWIGLGRTERRQAHGTARVPAPASETPSQCSAAPSGHDRLERTRA